MMPSGRTLVLLTDAGDALWGSSFQVASDGTLMAFHAWPMAWNCSIFRNESEHLSSELIREAIAATRHAWGEPPEQGFVTFVDAGKVRRKRDPGRCFLRAGFRKVGETGSGKVVLLLNVADFPPAEPAIGSPGPLFESPRALDPTRQRTAPGQPYRDR